MSNAPQATITISAQGTIQSTSPLPETITLTASPSELQQYKPVMFVFDQSLQTYITDDAYSVYLTIGGVAREIQSTESIVEYFTLQQEFTISLLVKIASGSEDIFEGFSKGKCVGDDPTSTTGEIIVRVG